MAMVIKSAKKVRQYAKVCFWGVEKSGKTHAALDLATNLAGENGKIGVISSERGSSALLAWKFPHDLIDLTVDEGNNPMHNPYTPKRYEEALQTFVKAGYQVIIVDSLSHVWEGEGGVLEFVDSKGSNSYTSGWKEGTPLYNKFLNALLAVPCHLIVTLRAKDGYVQEMNEKGKVAPKNVGLKPIIRERFGFEMQFMVYMANQVGHVNSSAYQEEIPNGSTIERIPDMAETLSRWLAGDPPPERVPSMAESYRVGLEKKSWTKENFYVEVAKVINLPAVTRDTALSPEQLKMIAEAAQRGPTAEPAPAA